MTRPDLTIIVSPRERFGLAVRSLRVLIERTPPPFHLVYVDGNAPRHVATKLAAMARERGFDYLRTERYLSPNEARNLGMAHAKGRYVAFVDNDVIVSEGWLDRMIACAEETGAALVGPLYLEGEAARGVIHMASGEARIVRTEAGRDLYESHRLGGKRLRNVGDTLRREPCELVEYHCMLATREMLDRLGPLDEKLLSTHEHVDLCLSVAAAAGTIWFEPAAVVAYMAPPPFSRGDRAFYLLRWSHEWNMSSLRHFSEKWDLQRDEAALKRKLTWLDYHRKLALGRTMKLLTRPFGRQYDNWIANAADRFLERRITRPQLERRAQAQSRP